jgi:protein-disulfide isomerase
MQALKKEYGDKIRFVFKNLPILAPSSKTAAQYAEAIAMQDKEKGYEFHSALFENQAELRGDAEKFLLETAKSVGADVAKMKKTAKGDAVAKRIKADVDEARKYEFSGTPGFMVNGAAIHGAYPLEFFKKVVDTILAEKAG